MYFNKLILPFVIGFTLSENLSSQNSDSCNRLCQSLKSYGLEESCMTQCSKLPKEFGEKINHPNPQPQNGMPVTPPGANNGQSLSNHAPPNSYVPNQEPSKATPIANDTPAHNSAGNPGQAPAPGPGPAPTSGPASAPVPASAPAHNGSPAGPGKTPPKPVPSGAQSSEASGAQSHSAASARPNSQARSQSKSQSRSQSKSDDDSASLSSVNYGYSTTVISLIFMASAL